jgi:hypothetical protein
LPAKYAKLGVRYSGAETIGIRDGQKLIVVKEANADRSCAVAIGVSDEGLVRI